MPDAPPILPDEEELTRRAAEMRERGYTIVPNALTPQHLGTARAALDRIFAKEADIAAERGWSNEQLRVAYMLPQKDAFFRTLPLNPTVLPIMRRILGARCVLASLNGLSMTPGGREQPLHIDAPESTPGVTLYINAMYCLDDFTPANGCTRAVPGSNNRVFTPSESASYERDTIRLEAPAGSLIAFDGALFHAGSANTTDKLRRALHTYYCRSWVKPQWDYARSLTPDLQAELSHDQRQIFGLDSHTSWYDSATDQQMTTG